MADFNFVTRRVATGGALSSPADVDAIRAAGIDVVVDARSEFDDGSMLTSVPGIKYLWNPTDDDGAVKPVEYWKRTLDFVMPLLAVPHHKVLLHCAAGVNRGPSNAFCVLVAQGLSPETAESLMRTVRPQVGLRYKQDALHACVALGYV